MLDPIANRRGATFAKAEKQLRRCSFSAFQGWGFLRALSDKVFFTPYQMRREKENDDEGVGKPSLPIAR